MRRFLGVEAAVLDAAARARRGRLRRRPAWRAQRRTRCALARHRARGRSARCTRRRLHRPSWWQRRCARCGPTSRRCSRPTVQVPLCVASSQGDARHSLRRSGAMLPHSSAGLERARKWGRGPRTQPEPHCSPLRRFSTSKIARACTPAHGQTRPRCSALCLALIRCRGTRSRGCQSPQAEAKYSACAAAVIAAPRLVTRACCVTGAAR